SPRVQPRHGASRAEPSKAATHRTYKLRQPPFKERRRKAPKCQAGAVYVATEVETASTCRIPRCRNHFPNYGRVAANHDRKVTTMHDQDRLLTVTEVADLPQRPVATPALLAARRHRSP